MKKAIFSFALLALICLLINAFSVQNYIKNQKEFQTGKSLQTKSLKRAKNIVKNLQNYAKSLPSELEREQKIYLIKKEINEINFNQYFEKVYAFDSTGYYIAHYSKDYEQLNIFLEQDIKKHQYIKELLRHHSKEAYTTAKIFWTNHSIRHILTYIKKDEDLNIYYGCTIDFDSDLKIANANNFDSIIFYASFVVGLVIALFSIFITRRKYENNY